MQLVTSLSHIPCLSCTGLHTSTKRLRTYMYEYLGTQPHPRRKGSLACPLCNASHFSIKLLYLALSFTYVVASTSHDWCSPTPSVASSSARIGISRYTQHHPPLACHAVTGPPGLECWHCFTPPAGLRVSSPPLASPSGPTHPGTVPARPWTVCSGHRDSGC